VNGLISEEKKLEYGKRIANECKYHTWSDGETVKINKHALEQYGLDLGSFVTIRSVRDDEDSEKAMLGIYVGTVPMFDGRINNPVFYVIELKQIRAGCDTWWKPIRKEDYSLNCEEMRERHDFTWEEIKLKVSELMKHLNLSGK